MVKVIEVMGSPTAYKDWGMRVGIKLSYGMSTVTIKKGRVTEFDNFDGNLKVKLTN
ncbi:hypothetical protein N9D26_00180 [bacterium]|nr:hypothetical protein [bacterium]